MAARGGLVAVALLAVGSASAYPLSPSYAWDRTQAAETIVLADVTLEVPPSTPIEGGGGRMRLAGDVTAHLRVLESWKGVSAGNLAVTYPRFLVCPAPPRFRDGQRAVVWLLLRAGAWEVVGLSDGVVDVTDDADLGAWRDRTIEAVALQESRANRRARVEWLVRCAEHPATRDEALHALAPRTDWFDRAFDRVRRPAYGRSLTPSQRARIRQGVLQAPPALHEVPLVVAVLAGRDEDLDAVLVRVIETALADPDTRWALADAMAAVAVRLGVPRRDAEPRELGGCLVSTGDYPLLSAYRERWRELLALAGP